MTDYTLHCFMESGNAYKAALMLELNGADWQPVWVDFFNGETRTEDFRALNVMGEVPVLVDHTMRDANDENLTLSQSGTILYHLCERFTDYAPRDRLEEREVLRWILFDNQKLTGMVGPYRFLSHFKHQENEATAFLRGRMLNSFKILETHLANREWVAANHCTVADLSLCGYLFWPDEFGVDWKDYPAIARWLERIAALPRYARPEQILPTATTDQVAL